MMNCLQKNEQTFIGSKQAVQMVAGVAATDADTSTGAMLFVFCPRCLCAIGCWLEQKAEQMQHG